jgi:UDP-N-acetylmuramoyl-L-alanyl-D-glutamate--2,6-diaminopimelate ligase
MGLMFGFDRLVGWAVRPGRSRALAPEGSGSGLVLDPKVTERELDRMVDLEDLARALPGAELLRFPGASGTGSLSHPEGEGLESQTSLSAVTVTDICHDSRKARAGSVFFAIPGIDQDGATFASEAVGRGAVAVVAPRPLPVPVPLLIVEDVRAALSRVASIFYGQPSRVLPVAGITGTNGKTTVAHLLAACLQDTHGPVGILGTLGGRLGYDKQGNEIQVSLVNTTPGALEIHRLLREMISNDCGSAVLEVSSHALDQGRVHDVRFQAAVFTSLSQDHLDYHGSMEAYARAKAKLFGLLEKGGVAVLPADDPEAAVMRKRVPTGIRLVTWALDKPQNPAECHLQGEILSQGPTGTRLRVHAREGMTDLDLPLIGVHNARNAMTALAAAMAFKVPLLFAVDRLGQAIPVAGRLEEMGEAGKGFPIFVDYAHTPDALEKVCQAVQGLRPKKLHLVFGCGGDRDRLKRKIMGRIAAQNADHIVVTNDNPRTEDPERILEMILEGVEPREGLCVEICLNRGEAIRHVLEQAKEGDAVLIAGKGHEQGQVIGKETIPFDDREEVKAWLRRN